MKTHMFIIINLLTTLMFFTSCKQDAEESFFFKIETGLLEWHVGAEGGQQEYIVESNAPWQIVHKGIGTWSGEILPILICGVAIIFGNGRYLLRRWKKTQI